MQRARPQLSRSGRVYLRQRCCLWGQEERKEKSIHEHFSCRTRALNRRWSVSPSLGIDYWGALPTWDTQALTRDGGSGVPKIRLSHFHHSPRDRKQWVCGRKPWNVPQGIEVNLKRFICSSENQLKIPRKHSVGSITPNWRWESRVSVFQQVGLKFSGASTRLTWF